jgi:hypothetical protein
MSSLERDRRTAFGLVLAATAAMGAAAALWRPAGTSLVEPSLVLDEDMAALEADAAPAVALATAFADEPGRGECRVYLVYDQPEPIASELRQTWLRSLAAWLLALLSCSLALTVLGRVGSLRRPLTVTLRTPRPVSGLLLVLLLLPMLPQLVLVHAGCPLLPTLLWLGSTGGGLAAAAMLLARRRLRERLRWAVDGGGALSALDDGTQVAAEVEPRELVPPPGAAHATPWPHADLSVDAGGEAARVALDGALVDEAAARRIAEVAAGRRLPAGARLTVVGQTTRVPADAHAVAALCRTAPLQVRLGRGFAGRALIVAGPRSGLMRQLRIESALCAGALCVFIGGALFAFLS